MGRLVDTLTGLASPWAYIVIGALAALEASAFVGLFIPGELALLIGGYIAHQGHARLDVMMIVAGVAAIAGDSVGYEIGRHLGGRLRTGIAGRRIGPERWDRAEAYLEATGGRAIFLGRFIGILRALVPALAGAARMPYRRFLAWNAAGALIWAPGIVLLGYIAGSSYQRIEHYAGRAGLLLLTVAAAVAGIVFTAHWISANNEHLRRHADTQLNRPRVSAIRSRYRAQLDFLGRRLTPTGALGLSLTVQLALLAAGGWLFGSVLQDVIARDDLARFDRPITNYMVDHRTAWLTTTMRAITTLGSTAVLLPTIALIGLGIRNHRHTWEPLALLVITQLGAIALYDTVKVLVARPRPAVGQLVATASGYAFPSGHATQAAAVWGAIALTLMPTASATTAKVALGAGAATIALIVGVSRVYLGVHWTTDVIGGWALGAIWLSAITTTRNAVTARRSNRTGSEGPGHHGTAVGGEER